MSNKRLIFKDLSDEKIVKWIELNNMLWMMC